MKKVFSKIDENCFEAKISFTNLNSSEKLLEIIDNYLHECNRKINYIIENNTKDLLTLNFKNHTDIANCIYRYAKIIKLENKEFSNLNCKIGIKIKNSYTLNKKKPKFLFQSTSTTDKIINSYNYKTKEKINSDKFFIGLTKKKNNNRSYDKSKIYENIFFMEKKGFVGIEGENKNNKNNNNNNYNNNNNNNISNNISISHRINESVDIDNNKKNQLLNSMKNNWLIQNKYSNTDTKEKYFVGKFSNKGEQNPKINDKLNNSPINILININNSK